MSQHILSTTNAQGIRVKLVLGWDRPLGEFFATVRREDPTDDEDDDGLLYASLYDPSVDTSSLDYFRAKFTALGISVPATMFSEVQTDAERNAGNRITEFRSDGSFVELHKG